MNEAEIRQLAALHSLLAEIKAVETEVEGMKYENEQRLSLGLSIAYSSKDFMESANDLRRLSEKLKTDI